MSLAYVSLNGVPLGRGFRSRVAWYGDAELIPHLLAVLGSGAVDVTVSWGEAVAYDMSADRKAITRDAEQSVRRMTAAALRPRDRPRRLIRALERTLRRQRRRGTICSRLAPPSQERSMEIRNLGGSGLRVSPSASAATISASASTSRHRARSIHKALDLGITLFDTADIYGNRGGSETVLGEVLGDRRKDIVLATKFAMPMDDDGTLKGASRRYIMTAVEASLKRLKTDYIDLYQLHRPIR